MAYLPEIAAALFLGQKVETLQCLSNTCPKKGDDRTLKFVKLDGKRPPTSLSTVPPAPPSSRLYKPYRGIYPPPVQQQRRPACS